MSPINRPTHPTLITNTKIEKKSQSPILYGSLKLEILDTIEWKTDKTRIELASTNAGNEEKSLFMECESPN